MDDRAGSRDIAAFAWRRAAMAAACAPLLVVAMFGLLAFPFSDVVLLDCLVGVVALAAIASPGVFGTLVAEGRRDGWEPIVLGAIGLLTSAGFGIGGAFGGRLSYPLMGAAASSGEWL